MTDVMAATDITKSFGSDQVLRGISMSLKKGETKVLLGPSGSGKSTFLRCINRLTLPDSGRVTLSGVEVTTDNETNMRRRIGFVFQEFNLFMHLTALDNVRVSLVKIKKMPKAEATAKARAVLEKVGLAQKEKSYPAELSGGQQQRVSIARALAMDPELILFDEPTSALDPELTQEVVQVMADLSAEGMTMLVVSHEMGFARAAADELVFMENGVVVETGPPEKLFTAPEAERTRSFLRLLSDGEPAQGPVPTSGARDG